MDFSKLLNPGIIQLQPNIFKCPPPGGSDPREDIAAKLKLVIDRCFTGDLRRISNQPEGTPQEGVPLDKQRVGTLNAGDIDVDLVLTRIYEG